MSNPFEVLTVEEEEEEEDQVADDDDEKAAVVDSDCPVRQQGHRIILRHTPRVEASALTDLCTTLYARHVACSTYSVSGTWELFLGNTATTRLPQLSYNMSLSTWINSTRPHPDDIRKYMSEMVDLPVDVADWRFDESLVKLGDDEDENADYMLTTGHASRVLVTLKGGGGLVSTRCNAYQPRVWNVARKVIGRIDTAYGFNSCVSVLIQDGHWVDDSPQTFVITLSEAAQAQLQKTQPQAGQWKALVSSREFEAAHWQERRSSAYTWMYTGTHAQEE